MIEAMLAALLYETGRATVKVAFLAIKCWACCKSYYVKAIKSLRRKGV